jgi:hypothetical protein
MRFVRITVVCHLCLTNGVASHFVRHNNVPHTEESNFPMKCPMFQQIQKYFRTKIVFVDKLWLIDEEKKYRVQKSLATVSLKEHFCDIFLSLIFFSSQEPT